MVVVATSLLMTKLPVSDQSAKYVKWSA